jgi:hypothetical protein
MYKTPTERSQEVVNERTRLQRALDPWNIPAPTPFLEEDKFNYQKRATLPLLQQHAPGAVTFKDSDLREGAMMDLVVDQLYESATREAQRPTMVPDGELKQIIRRDAAGRPFYEWYGKAASWLREYGPDKKMRLVGIRTRTDHSYNPGNLG